MPPDPPPPEDELDPATRAGVERAERAWQRQVEREQSALDRSGGMTPLRWILVAIAAVFLILLIAKP